MCSSDLGTERGNPIGIEGALDEAVPPVARLPLAGDDFVLFAEALRRHIMPTTEAVPFTTRRRSPRARLPRGQLQSLVMNVFLFVK